MKRIVLAVAVLMLAPWAIHAEEKPVARTVVALYDSAIEPQIPETLVRSFLEMPLNYLGYDVVYRDLQGAFDAPTADTAAITLWLPDGYAVKDPDRLLAFLNAEAAKGRKLLLFGTIGMPSSYFDNPARINALAAHVGFRWDGTYNALTHRDRITFSNDTMVGYERPLPLALPPYAVTRIVAPDAISYLTLATKKGTPSDIVITSPRGGYVPTAYAVLMGDAPEGRSMPRKWLIDPFRYLEAVLGHAAFPVPDVTTLGGNRIFFSHIDGDGWNNLTEIDRYHGQSVGAGHVIADELIASYPQIGFTIGVVGADVDPECQGAEDGILTARKLLARDNVEAASHTYSHPLYWNFFADGNTEKEAKYLDRYPPRIKEARSAPEMHDHPLANPEGKPSSDDLEAMGYHVPRSYACSPFNLEQEVKGSRTLIEALTDGRKKVKLMQWSGDTTPFEAAVQATRDAGMRNINGGDSRFDSEYPSVAWLAPLGTRVGNAIQIYAPNSNEYTYTDDWAGRYFGFRYLIETFDNTDKDRRLKPMNVYFHMFSGQKQASLDAIKTGIDHALAQEIVPIWASEYAAMADGFYATRLVALGDDAWRVENRGGLSTLRVDDKNRTVDYARSKGVLGHRLIHDSLYVALDPTVDAPVVAFGAGQRVPSLVSSRWQVRRLKRDDHAFSFRARGFGPGEMVWRVPEGVENVHVAYGEANEVVTVRERRAHFTLPETSHQPLDVSVTWEPLP